MNEKLTLLLPEIQAGVQALICFSLQQAWVLFLYPHTGGGVEDSREFYYFLVLSYQTDFLTS